MENPQEKEPAPKINAETLEVQFVKYNQRNFTDPAPNLIELNEKLKPILMVAI